MTKFNFKSYCKINLFLKILKKYKNGYHKIQSLITFCGIYDVIKVSVIKKKNDKITFFGKFRKKIVSKKNTFTKVLYILRQKGKLKNTKFSILVKKNIPHGSGLGGGSSNAANFLYYLNLKFKLGLTKRNFFLICNKIGSDVPLFIEKKNSILIGKKNQIKRLNIKFNLAVLIVYPNITCSTKSIYMRNKIFSTGETYELKNFKNKQKLINLLKNENNDLQKTVIKIYPKIETLLNLILKQQGCYFSRITGSGSACIGVFSNIILAKRANNLIKKIFPKYWSVVSKTI